MTQTLRVSGSILRFLGLICNLVGAILAVVEIIA
jgi:hypothetical protein